GAAWLSILSLVLGAGGCKSGYDTASPGGASASNLVAPQPLGAVGGLRGGRQSFPLAVGDHWDYHTRFQTTITTPEGTQPPDILESPWAVEITGSEQIGDLTYFHQSEFDPNTGRGPSFFRMRQDRSGLFELDPPDAVASKP